MPQERFFDNLRIASRFLGEPRVAQKGSHDKRLNARLNSADIWLTPNSVGDFDPKDFSDWPEADQRELSNNIAAFLEIAGAVPGNKPATSTQSAKARKALESVIGVVRRHLLADWLQAQQSMIDEASDAAAGKGWFVEQDQKDVSESLLGEYQAPRLRIRSLDREVVLDPIALFGSGSRGIVDLVLLPRFETKYLVTFKDGDWRIVSPFGKMNSRPFSGSTLVNTITRLAPNR